MQATVSIVTSACTQVDQTPKVLMLAPDNQYRFDMLSRDQSLSLIYASGSGSGFVAFVLFNFANAEVYE